MSDLLINDIETMVSTLLLVGDSVAEVSRDQVILQIWQKGNSGLSTSNKKCLGKRLSEVPKDHILGWATDQLHATLATGQNSYREFSLPTVNGLISYSVRILNNHPDRDCFFIVTEQLVLRNSDNFDEVNFQKSINEALGTREFFYENLLSDIAADIVVFDDQLRFLYVNPVAVKNDEMRAWLIGKTDADYCRLRNKPMDIAETRMSYYRQAIEEKRIVEFEEKSVNAVGEVIYYLRRVRPMFHENGVLNVIVGYGLNITDRKIAEKTLKASEDTFASAFGYSGIGMCLVNLEGKWIDVNSAFCLMTGYPREELLQFTFQDITYHEDVNMVQNLVRTLLRKEIKSKTIEQRYVANGNKIVWVLLTLSLVWNPDGTPKFYIAQVVDITQKKELESEIKRRNSELESSKQSLMNKVDQLEELSYIIAHNLRGPAGNIRTLAETMSEIDEGIENNESNNSISLEECVQFIKDSSDSLLNSLDTLMEIASIKLNKEVPYQDCDVRVVLNEITSQLQSQIYEKQAKIVLETSLDTVNYPKAYLENVLYNLVSNALKYSRPDLLPVIIVKFITVDGKVQLTVKDNGLGIDLARYGDKVFKLNQVFHKGFNSKGIGLYITKTQVESLGGGINLISSVNEGSEFIVAL